MSMSLDLDLFFSVLHFPPHRTQMAKNQWSPSWLRRPFTFWALPPSPNSVYWLDLISSPHRFHAKPTLFKFETIRNNFQRVYIIKLQQDFTTLVFPLLFFLSRISLCVDVLVYSLPSFHITTLTLRPRQSIEGQKEDQQATPDEGNKVKIKVNMPT